MTDIQGHLCEEIIQSNSWLFLDEMMVNVDSRITSEIFIDLNAVVKVPRSRLLS